MRTLLESFIFLCLFITIANLGELLVSAGGRLSERPAFSLAWLTGLTTAPSPAFPSAGHQEHPGLPMVPPLEMPLPVWQAAVFVHWLKRAKNIYPRQP